MSEHVAIPCPLCHTMSLSKHCAAQNKRCEWHKCLTCKATLDLAKRIGFDHALNHIEFGKA